MKKREEKRKSPFTSYNDGRIYGFFVMMGFDALAFIYCIYLCKKRDMPLSSLLGSFSLRHGSPYIWAFTIIGLYYLITWIIYKVRCNIIIKKGKLHKEADLIDFDYLSKLGNRSQCYSYKVKLPDGRIIKTERYMFNNYCELVSKKCTVYEYKGRYYCTKFR